MYRVIITERNIILIDFISVSGLQNNNVKVRYIDIPSAQLSDII